MHKIRNFMTNSTSLETLRSNKWLKRCTLANPYSPSFFVTSKFHAVHVQLSILAICRRPIPNARLKYAHFHNRQHDLVTNPPIRLV